MLRYRANLRRSVSLRNTNNQLDHSSCAVDPSSVDEMRNAEMETIKNIQKKHFQDELSRLMIAPHFVGGKKEMRSAIN